MTAGRRDTRSSTSRPESDPWLLAITLAALVVLNLVNHLVLDEWLYVPVNLVAAGTLLALARHRGLTTDELAVDRGQLRRGASWGLRSAAAIVIAVVGVLGVGLVVFPEVSGAVGTADPSPSAEELAYTVLVRIPLGTALTEELLFRSVLFGVLRRHTSTVRAAVWSSVVFGLWHVLPTVDPASTVTGGPATVLGTVVVTSGAGLGLVWLRLRAGHVLAPVLAHASINTAALLVAMALRAPGGG